VFGVEIRAATPDDWPEIWPIFSEVVQTGETYAFDPAMTSDEAQALWLEKPPGQTVVALVDGAVVGTAKMGPNRPARGSHVGTASFMVGSAGRGHGVGRVLATYVIDWHRDQGYRGIQFNAVVETNTAAVALWQSLGFEIVGTVPGGFDHPTEGHVGLHVMYLDLSRPQRGTRVTQ
jgi:L-amino acid N-acyltransferase YncA